MRRGGAREGADYTRAGADCEAAARTPGRARRVGAARAHPGHGRATGGSRTISAHRRPVTVRSGPAGGTAEQKFMRNQYN
jgi:hypothetical protein